MDKTYRINTEVSTLENIRSLDEIQKHLDQNRQYLVVAYLVARIGFGSYENGFRLQTEELEFDQIESIRIFDDEQELYLYRPWDRTEGKASETLRGRKRTDGTGNELYCKDVLQILTGSMIAERIEDYVVIREKRGFELCVPEEWISKDPGKTRLILKTRNYLTEWDNGQLSYYDHRFVSIFQAN